MYRLATRMLRDDDAARDIVHDVFDSLLHNGPADVPLSYLLRSVRNRCINYRRNLTLHERIACLYANEDLYDDNWPDEETLSKINATIENELSAACQRVVHLKFAGGKSYREIASMLEISEVAVYKHLRHAIDVLRNKLK